MKTVVKNIYRIILVIIGLFGVYLNIKLSGNFSVLPYYTLQSNIICIVLLTVLLIFDFSKKSIDTNKYSIFKGMTLTCILVTMIIYHFLLKPSLFSMDINYNPNGLNDIIVHTVMPLGMLFDYLFFDKKGKFKWIYGLYFLLIPFLYMIFVYVYPLFGGSFWNSKYPYFFFDIEVYGIFGVFKYCLLIAIGIYALANLLILVDKLLGGKK